MSPRPVVIIGAGAVLAAAWWAARQSADQADSEGDGGLLEDAGDLITSAGQAAAEAVDSITGGFLKVSAMANVSPFDADNPNVRALLAVIRRGEGTADADGYRRLFGGKLFTGWADHPRVKVTAGRYTSTAAGAYQMLASTWDETRRLMRLADFSPRSQDLAAVGRLAARGALEDAKAGRFETALRKIAKEWASLPGSPYGQPTISMDTARSVYAQAGGDTMTA